MNKHLLDTATNFSSPAERGETVSYSDGSEVEEHLLEVISRASDRSLFSPELALHVRDWPTTYHLSPGRANLLRPVASLVSGRVLEAGAGCGAVTRYLGECGADVTAVEGSPRRARIAAERCRDLANVRVSCENVFHLPPRIPFDAIICVGVLEYSRIYGGGDIGLALHKLRTLLSDRGVVIIAIENQLGLKYLAGAPEDHMGEPYWGVNDRYEPGGPVTIGHREWERNLKLAGFPNLHFLYPLPDYKLPALVIDSAAFDEPRLKLGSMARPYATSSYPCQYQGAFSEQMAWPLLVRNGLAGALANSFLILASPDPAAEFAGKRTLVYRYATERLPQFAKQLTIERGDDGRLVTRSRRLNPALPERHKGYRHDVSDGVFHIGEEYIDGLYTVLNRPGWSLQQVYDWARPWLRFLDRHLHNGDFLPPEYVDCIPRNLIVAEDGELTPFDLEFVSQAPVPASFVRFRGLFYSLAAIGSCAPPAPGISPAIFSLTLEILCLHGRFLSSDSMAACIEQECRLQEAIRGLPPEVTSQQLSSALLQLRRLDSLDPRSDGNAGGVFRCQLFWRSSKREYTEAASSEVLARCGENLSTMNLWFPPSESDEDVCFRLDLSDRPGLMDLRGLAILDQGGRRVFSWNGDTASLRSRPHQQITFLPSGGYAGAHLLFDGMDPWIEIRMSPGEAAALKNGGRVELMYSSPPPGILALQTLARHISGIEAHRQFHCQLFWRDSEREYNEQESTGIAVEPAEEVSTLRLTFPSMKGRENVRFRLDPSDRPGFMHLRALSILNLTGECVWSWDGVPDTLRSWPHNQVRFLAAGGDAGAVLVFEGTDPWVEIHIDPEQTRSLETGGWVEVTHNSPQPGWLTQWHAAGEASGGNGAPTQGAAEKPDSISWMSI